MALYVNGKQVSGGGDGDASKRELTWAEYQALTEAEKNNGTMYFCNDVNGDDSEFQPVIYSEEEREIGVWTDGKPLYEKSYPITNTNISTGWNTLINNVSDIDTFVSGECNLTDSSSYDYSWKASYHYNGNIAIYNFLGGAISSANGYVTIRYTKTADTAGSGTWTPQGVPAQHYSTDEQVVGTWIDGSVLYEKTIEKAVTCGSEQTIINTTDIPNLDKIITVDGSFGGASLGIPLNYYDTANYRSYINIDNANHALRGYIKLDTISSINSYFIIRYTKTTT